MIGKYRHRPLFLIFCSLLIALPLSGCVRFKTYNAATERHEFILLSPQDEVSIGQEAHKNILNGITARRAPRPIVFEKH